MQEKSRKKIKWRLKQSNSEQTDFWTIFENTQEAIIDEHTFNTVQELLKTKRTTKYLDEPANPLTGKMYCADCGAKMYNHRHKYGRVRKDIERREPSRRQKRRN